MSRERFVIADTHFSQVSMCVFGKDGVPLRPWGRHLPEWKDLSAEAKADLMPEFEERAREMDEAMVDNWNSVVPKEGATVYHLGDVTMKARYLPILNRLHGKKKLILGNHDIFPAKVYLDYFYDVTAYRVKDGIIMSHIPVHEDSLKERWLANVHGHLHAGRVTYKMLHEACGIYGEDETTNEIHPKYFSVSVEQINYRPLSWDTMIERIRLQKENSDGY